MLNSVILIGNLGKDPEIKTTQKGDTFAKLSLATNEFRKDGEDFIEITQWHQCVIWDTYLANRAAKAQKGQKVALQGMVKYRSYEKDGVTKYATDIEVPRFGGNFQIVEKGTNGSAEEMSPTPVTAADLDDDIPF